MIKKMVIVTISLCILFTGKYNVLAKIKGKEKFLIMHVEFCQWKNQY